jgi:hypothetical protein
MSAAMQGVPLSAVAAEALARLRAIRSEIVTRTGAGRFGGSYQDDEWWSYSPEFRLCAVMLAGIEGDTAALCVQRWQRFTPPERDALAAALRSLRRGAQRVRACAL